MAARVISAEQISEQVIDAIGEIYQRPTLETAELLRRALDSETHPLARDILQAILLNHQIAASEKLPLCQDTGLLIVFAELGNELLITGGTLTEIIGKAAAQAWKLYYLRDSIAPDPLRCQLSAEAQNHAESKEIPPNSPLPFILHLDQVLGNKLTLHIALKGGGAENCSALKMFLPSTSTREIEEFIVQTVVTAGGKPCPPVFVGVGIGGDFESCAIMSKRALLVSQSGDDATREMEQRILNQINRLGKGVMGIAGNTSALKVTIITRPCHIASLPVAVNIDCHAHRLTRRTI